MSRLPLAQGRATSNRLSPKAPTNNDDHHKARSHTGEVRAEGEAEDDHFRSRAAGSRLRVQFGGHRFAPKHFPFQPLPKPRGAPPYRFDLSQLLHHAGVDHIAHAERLVFHVVGDTGDEHGKGRDLVAEMMAQDYDASAHNAVPAFLYHLGDVVYFAGDVNAYAERFYAAYSDYPAPIVAIAGNHDCQPDDPQDGPIDPNKKPLDGWIQNFMSDDPTRLGSLKTTSARTQMDLPNVYWTLTTPFATIIGLFSNVSENEAELHKDQIDWFREELLAAAKADPKKALIVAIHHPPFSGDTDHSGSTEAEKILFKSFEATDVWPHLIMSGHVHNYQRFSVREKVGRANIQIASVVIGNCGYSRLGKLHKIGGRYPRAPLRLSNALRLEKYDHDNFGFLRLEVTPDAIVGVYNAAHYAAGASGPTKVLDRWKIPLRAVTTTAHQKRSLFSR